MMAIVKRTLILTALLAATLVAVECGFCAPAASQTRVDSLVKAEIELRKIVNAKDDGLLVDFMRDETQPDIYRARALKRIFRKKSKPLTADDRVVLIETMKSGGPTMKMASVQIIAEMKEQALIRQVLQLALEDEDEHVKIEALKAARPWTRLSHLFFLEAALDSDSPDVSSEALTSLGSLSAREVRPDILEKVKRYLSSDNPPHVRRIAIDVLNQWGKADWEDLRGIILDTQAPDVLRVHVLEMSDDVVEAVRLRHGLLKELVNAGNSVAITWRAFRRAKTAARSDKVFILSLARFLKGIGQQNIATNEIAAYLRGYGLKVEHRAGAWNVTQGR